MTDTDSQLADSFKQAMRRVAATVNVISICVDGQPMGITATAVSVVSMDPPSLLVCVNQAASVHPKIENVVHFNVNVLHRDQAEVATIFADRKLEAQRFIRGWDNDCVTPPRLRDAQASILCRRIDHHRFGTHSIFIGVVEDVVAREEIDPLIYLDGKFGELRRLAGEQLGRVAHRLDLERVAGGVAEEHRRLLARLAPEADGRRDRELDPGRLEPRRQHFPRRPSPAPRRNAAPARHGRRPALLALPGAAPAARWATIWWPKKSKSIHSSELRPSGQPSRPP